MSFVLMQGAELVTRKTMSGEVLAYSADQIMRIAAKRQTLVHAANEKEREKVAKHNAKSYMHPVELVLQNELFEVVDVDEVVDRISPTYLFRQGVRPMALPKTQLELFHLIFLSHLQGEAAPNRNIRNHVRDKLVERDLIRKGDSYRRRDRYYSSYYLTTYGLQVAFNLFWQELQANLWAAAAQWVNDQYMGLWTNSFGQIADVLAAAGFAYDFPSIYAAQPELPEDQRITVKADVVNGGLRFEFTLNGGKIRIRGGKNIEPLIILDNDRWRRDISDIQEMYQYKEAISQAYTIMVRLLLWRKVKCPTAYMGWESMLMASPYPVTE